MNEPWSPPEAPLNGVPVMALDPRVDVTHRIGVLPCPKNPPPPDGWEYWKGPVPAALGAIAIDVKKDAVTYPMGSFVQMLVEGALVALRVEWHDFKGLTGEKGCFRGVNLMRAVAQPMV